MKIVLTDLVGAIKLISNTKMHEYV